MIVFKFYENLYYLYFILFIFYSICILFYIAFSVTLPPFIDWSKTFKEGGEGLFANYLFVSDPRVTFLDYSSLLSNKKVLKN